MGVQDFLLACGGNASAPSQPLTDVGSQAGFGEGWHQTQVLRGTFCGLTHMDLLTGKRVQQLSVLQCAFAFQSWCAKHRDELHEKLPQINAWYLTDESAKALSR